MNNYLLVFCFIWSNLIYCQVGVGTTTPITLFQVNGDSSTSNGISLIATQDYDAIGISHNGTIGFLNVAGADNGFSLRVSGSNTGTILSQTYNEALRILPNGNVGVGTNSPVAKLEVNGDLKVNNVPVLVDIENSRLLMVDINGNVKQISLSNLANDDLDVPVFTASEENKKWYAYLKEN
jgi:hypothetical protein